MPRYFTFSASAQMLLPKALLATGALISAASPVLSAVVMAQDNPPAYNGQTEQGANAPSPQGYGSPQGYNPAQGAPPAEPAPPQGYAAGQAPPPPPGYNPAQANPAQQATDAQYAQSAQYWMQQNCVKSHGDAAAGAVVGGIFGAILGGALGGRHSGGALVGGVVGAGTGAAVADSSGGGTSPGCPQGYVLRQGAAPYVAPAGYYYAAPSWYVPWVFIGGTWVFRPYPYHDWYWRTYHRPYGYYRGGYHGGYHGHRGW